MIKSRISVSPLFKFSKVFTSQIATMTRIQEKKIKLKDWNVNYLQVGTGETKVVCLPGALGSMWTDFKPQIEGFDRKAFTLIAWDPPGYGKSQPPKKEFSVDFYEKDAELTHEFMKALDIPEYSVLGWSDGGIAGLVLAARRPRAVQRLVVWGSNSFIMPHELEQYEKTRDIKAWSPRMRQPMVDMYGEAEFARLWSAWCDAMRTIYHANGGNICAHLLKDIRCPTLIVHGEKDPMVDAVHVNHLHTHIQGSRVHLYPEGKHNIHLRYAEDFNRRVQEYLLLK